ncbi:DUF1801 domain-containing protein [Microbacterium sp.]|uniref:DUF1801 domain-containing protein n=1 Tax=Microbacterium sp. TaxID=51671 RepID=UPI002733236F|nr:DUF1801 domain-containing protein [Microbacterium sp.]MDP3949335.1 DUF1801 domain-containing protein [Microbacterium sp.]
MGEPGTGLINRGGVEDGEAFHQLLVGRPDRVQSVAAASRDLVYEVLPEAVEVVWLTQGSAGWGTGPKKFTEQFAYLMPFKNHVTLGFYYGGDLIDPTGLLPTEGGRQAPGRLSMRSMKPDSVSDVENPALRDLIAYAATHIPPP